MHGVSGTPLEKCLPSSKSCCQLRTARGAAILETLLPVLPLQPGGGHWLRFTRLLCLVLVSLFSFFGALASRPLFSLSFHLARPAALFCVCSPPCFCPRCCWTKTSWSSRKVSRCPCKTSGRCGMTAPCVLGPLILHYFVLFCPWVLRRVRGKCSRSRGGVLETNPTYV